jgi:biotin transport system substrate-specific component
MLVYFLSDALSEVAMKITIKEMILTALFAALTAVGAFIKVPLPYIPFTLQYFFCAFAGIFLGARLGAVSQILYIIIGLIGIPVFTEGGGPSYVLKPTFGYLIGFIAAAWAIGKILQNDTKPSILKLIAAQIAGLVPMYVIGVIYLYFISNVYLKKGMPFTMAVKFGFIPFIGADLVKIIAAALIAYKVVPLLKKSII